MRKKAISLLVTQKEMKLIDALRFYEPFLVDNLHRAKRQGKFYNVSFEREDFVDFYSAVEVACHDKLDLYDAVDVKKMRKRLDDLVGELNQKKYGKPMLKKPSLKDDQNMND